MQKDERGEQTPPEPKRLEIFHPRNIETEVKITSNREMSRMVHISSNSYKVTQFRITNN